MFNPFKGTIRKVKAGYIASTIIAVFYLFGIDFDAEQSQVIEEVIQAIIVFIPTIVAFYTKMTKVDVAKVVLIEEKTDREEIRKIKDIQKGG